LPAIPDSARLRYRDITIDDVDLLVALDSDPEVMRFLSGGKPTPREKAEATVAGAIGHRWLAFERSSDEFVGWFSLPPTAEGERELGYRLRRAMWGRGLGSEGVQAMLAHAFDFLDTDRVWAQTMTINVASRRLLERSGLRFVRTFFGDYPETIPGDEDGAVEYEILRAEWPEGGR
jgi:RimJ/RimL family protein N-acetyltransferase